jgi:Flp pilus assembly protein TadB
MNAAEMNLNEAEAFESIAKAASEAANGFADTFKQATGAKAEKTEATPAEKRAEKQKVRRERMAEASKILRKEDGSRHYGYTFLLVLSLVVMAFMVLFVFELALVAVIAILGEGLLGLFGVVLATAGFITLAEKISEIMNDAAASFLIYAKKGIDYVKSFFSSKA